VYTNDDFGVSIFDSAVHQHAVCLMESS